MSTLRKQIEDIDISIQEYQDIINDLIYKRHELMNQEHPKQKLDDDSAWEMFINNTQVRKNVSNILKRSYFDLITTTPNAKQMMGDIGSNQWNYFVDNVMRVLRQEGLFESNEIRYNNSFEDTADGCDVLTLDIAMDIINGHSE